MKEKKFKYDRFIDDDIWAITNDLWYINHVIFTDGTKETTDFLPKYLEFESRYNQLRSDMRVPYKKKDKEDHLKHILCKSFMLRYAIADLRALITAKIKKEDPIEKTKEKAKELSKERPNPLATKIK
jgi:hypothetical protein